MYSLLLTSHSWLRWVILLAAVFTILRAAAGMRGGQSWGGAADAGMRVLSISLDIQFLIGLILYAFLSPLTQAALQDMGSAMRNSAVRFFVVEHFVGMLIAVILVHVGRAQIRKATSEEARYKRAVVFTAIALLVMIASIPWPGLPAGRPLFRI